MLFVLSGGNWNNGVNAGVRARNLNNARTNSNNNVGFVADSSPCHAPRAARAARRRGSHLRGLRRNVEPVRLSVASAARVGGLAKTGVGHLNPGGAA